MRKLLQNKLVVTALAVVALLSVAANFVKLPKRLSLAAAREPSADPAVPTPSNFQVPGETEFSRNLRSWNDYFPVDASARDPFAPNVQSTTVEQPVVAPTNPTLPPTLVLQAVSIEANRPFAVINQTVLTEGESINGYRIERILPTHVRLSGSLGIITVDMARASQRQKTPTANAPAAVLPPVTARPESGTPIR